MKKIKHRVNGTDKVRDAVDTLTKAQQAKKRQCGEEIAAILNRHGYTLQIQPPQIILAQKPAERG